MAEGQIIAPGLPAPEYVAPEQAIPVGVPGSFTLVEIDPEPGRPARVFQTWLTKPPVVTAGYGGWSRVARPRRKALTEWVGRDSMSLEISFMLDRHADQEGRFVEDAVGVLEQFAGIDSKDREPPLVQLTGEPPPIIPHGLYRSGHTKWFVDALSWDGETFMVNRAGNRTRAGGTITLTQYVEDTRLEKLTPPKKVSGRVKHYRIKKGDTLLKIAARKDVYKDSKKWKKILEANRSLSAKVNGKTVKLRDAKFGGGSKGAQGGWIGKLLKIP